MNKSETQRVRKEYDQNWVKSVQNYRKDNLSNAWKNYNVEYICTLITGKVAGKKVRPDVYVWRATTERNCPGYHKIADFESENEALIQIRLWTGV